MSHPGEAGNSGPAPRSALAAGQAAKSAQAQENPNAPEVMQLAVTWTLDRYLLAYCVVSLDVTSKPWVPPKKIQKDDLRCYIEIDTCPWF